MEYQIEVLQSENERNNHKMKNLTISYNTDDDRDYYY